MRPCPLLLGTPAARIHLMDWLRDHLASRWGKRIDNKQAEREKLQETVTLREQRMYRRLDSELARLPIKRDHMMPTLLGNIMRAVEEYPSLRYGLVASVCWPRLFPLLSDELRLSLYLRNRSNA